MPKPKNYYTSIFLLLSSLLFGQMVRIPVFGKIILVSDIAVVLFLIFHSRKSIKSIKSKVHKTESYYLFLPIASFIFFSVISLVFATPSLGLTKVVTAGMYLVRWILYVSVVFVIASLPDREKAERTIFWGIIGVGLLLSITGFIQLKIHPDFADMVKFGWDPHKNRLLSTWFDPNLLAGYFTIVISFLSSYFVFKKFKVQSSKFKSTQNLNSNFVFSIWNSFELWFLNFELKNVISGFGFLISGFVIYLAAILTYSRSGYLALAAVFITICILKFNWKFFVAGIIIAPLTLMLLPRSYSRVSDAAAVDITSQMRIDSWQDGWSVIKKNPIFGVGFNTLQWQWDKDHPEHASSGCDSSLLTIWATTGIFGLLSYLWIIASLLKSKYVEFKESQTKNHYLNNDLNNDFHKIFALGSIAAIIGLLAHSIFVNSLIYPHILIAIWLLAC